LKGGQGEVKKACTSNGNNFAIKKPLKPSELRGQEREIRNYFDINSADHPHLAFLTDVVRHEGTPLIVTEWADFGSLENWLSWQRELNPSDRPEKGLEIAIQIARGLVSLHSDKLDLVHQDLKPGNVLNYKGVMKIADFGLSFSTSASVGEGGLERGGAAVAGTRVYMSPEQMLCREYGRRKRASEDLGGVAEELKRLGVDMTEGGEDPMPGKACDIWAFGLILAQLVGSESDAAAVAYLRGMSERSQLAEAASDAAGEAATIVKKLSGDACSGEVWTVVEQLLIGCVKEVPSERPNASTCVEQLELAYKTMTGKMFQAAPREEKGGFGGGLFACFPLARVRVARFHRIVRDDAKKAAQELRLQLKVEVEKLLARKTGNNKVLNKLGKDVKAALYGGASADVVLNDHCLWIPRAVMGWKAADFESSYLLPVLMDFVEAVCLGHEEGDDWEAVDAAAKLAAQAQSVWERVFCKDGEHEFEKCCSFRTGSSRESHSPLMKMCGMGGEKNAPARRRAVELLLKTGKPDVDKETKNNGKTALFIAAENGHKDVVNLLINAKAVVDKARKDYGRTPLYMAAENGHKDVV
jgi:hypothetical protein